MPANQSMPGILGAGLASAHSVALAQLDISGMTLGTQVYVVSLGVDFVLTVSSAPPSSTVVAVAGFPGLRWISSAPVMPAATGFWAGFAYAAISWKTGSDANTGFGASKANALSNTAMGMPAGALKTFGEFYRRIGWQRIARPIVWLLDAVPEGADSTIPPPWVYAGDRGDGTPNGITVAGEPIVVAGGVVLTGGTSGYNASNKRSIVEATGLPGSWPVSRPDTQGACFLRSRSRAATAPLLLDLGNKAASIGWPTNVDTSLPFATGGRAADFSPGETCDVVSFPIVPDVSPGGLPMSYQDIEFSRADRRNYAAIILSRGLLNLACCATTSTMWMTGANGGLWSGCLFADPVKVLGSSTLDIRQPALLGSGLVPEPLDFVTAACESLGITDWSSQGAVGYFSNGTLLRAIGDARVFDLDNPARASTVGAFSADGPTVAGLLFSSVLGAIQGLTWAVISNSLARMYGVSAASWRGINTHQFQAYALAESQSPRGLLFSDLPYVGDANHAGACITSGFN